MPRRNRLIKERARRLEAELNKADHVAKSRGGKVLKNQFKGHVRELARAYTEVAMEELIRLMTKSKSDNIRLLASSTVLERGWGKPAQAISGPDGEGEAVMRHVHEVKRTLVRPKAANDQDRQLRPELSVVRRSDR